jgi:hypothetical protein
VNTCAGCYRPVRLGLVCGAAVWEHVYEDEQSRYHEPRVSSPVDTWLVDQPFEIEQRELDEFVS